MTSQDQGNSVISCDIRHSVNEGLKSGEIGRRSKRQCLKRGGIAKLDKKVPHFQTFGLEVLIFTANRLFGVVGVGREKQKIAVGVSGLIVEHRSNQFNDICLFLTLILIYSSLVSLYSLYFFVFVSQFPSFFLSNIFGNIFY